VDWDENDLLLKQIDARGPALDRCVRLHDAHTSPSRRAPLCKHANAHILHERRLRYVSASSGSSTRCVTNGDKHLPIHIANATRGDGPDLLAADRGVALVEERIEQVRSLGRIPRQQMVLDVSAAPTDDPSKA
jgi:hypothetical protein